MPEVSENVEIVSILDEAKAIIHGDREKTYGNPGVNVQRIAALWAVIFGHEVSMDQVCLAMACVKIARLIHTPTHRDSQVDLPGYIALMERIQNHEAEPTAG